MTTLDSFVPANNSRSTQDRPRFFLYSRGLTEEFEHGIRETDRWLARGGRGKEFSRCWACIVDTVSERESKLLDELDRWSKKKARVAARD